MTVGGRAPGPGPSGNVAILGCGRSGTSILCELFDALPGYRGVSEPLLGELGDAPTGVAVKVPRTTPGTTPPPGCAVGLDELDAVLGPHLTILWQVRHPLDAVCSLRVGIADGWSHHPRPPDWQEWLERPLVERCAHHWATINTAGWREVRRRATVTRFEEMIGDPTAFAIGVARTVGVDVGADHPPLGAWADRVRDTNDERFVEAMTSRRHSRPDHARRVGRWEENLTDAEVAAVTPILRAGATTFGYPLP